MTDRRRRSAVPEEIAAERTSRVEHALLEARSRPGRETLLDDLAASIAQRQRSRASYWSGLLLAPTLAALVATGSWWLWARDSIRAAATREDVAATVQELETATGKELERARQERRDLREWQIRTTEIDRQQTKLIEALEGDVRALEQRRRR